MTSELLEEDTETQLDIDDTDKWDYVIVFDNILAPKNKDGTSKEEATKEMKKYKKIQDKRKEIFNRLRDPNGAGLRVQRQKVDKSGNAKLFLLITADDERFEVEAERLGVPYKLKPEYGGAYSEFEVSKKHLFEMNDPEKGQFFRKTQKFQLIESIIEAPLEEQGAGLSIISLSRKGIINKIFPLHEKSRKKWLMENWAKPKNLFRKQPIHEIRNYFGEEVAIYFAWLGFYTNWLWLSSAVGTVCFAFWIVGRYKKDNEWTLAIGWIQAIYSVFLALWATFFLEFWKRYQHTLSHQWGMDDYEEQERPRAEYAGSKKPGLYYKGEWIQPPWGAPVEEKKNLIETIGTAVGVDKELSEMKSVFEGEKLKTVEVEINDIPTPETEYYPTPMRNAKIFSAGPIIITFLIVVVIATFSILSFRLFVVNRVGSFGSFMGGILNAFLIMFLNQFWRRIAEFLTRWENHRTMTSYFDQLIFKIFAFQFVNSYTSLYYIAFFKNRNHIFNSNDLYDQCKKPLGDEDNTENLGNGCLDELMVQVLTLLGTNIVFGQTRKVILPWAISQLKFYLFKRATKMDSEERENIPQYQKEANLQNYTGTFDEYNEMVIQYGYVTLFAAAFPLAPLMAVINNIIEVRTDAIKFLTGLNRPFYRGAHDIGTWYGILEVIGLFAVITNCLLIGYALVPLYDLFDKDPYKIFVTITVLEHAIFLLKFVISFLIPDQPGIIRKAIAKQEYIKEQTYKKYSSRAEPRTWKNDVPESESKLEE